MPLSIVVPDDGTSTPSSGATVSDVVEEILLVLQGFSNSASQYTSLDEPLDITDTSLKVGSVDSIRAGLIEVGQELMWVADVDEQNRTVNLLPRGRGWRGTPTTSHAVGETVVIGPITPRSSIVRQINATLEELYPSLYAVRQSTFTFDDPTQSAWPIPSDAAAVLDVRYKDLHDNWQRVRAWEVEYTPDDSGRTGAVRFNGVPVGQQVQVVYGARPSALTEGETLEESGMDVPLRALLVAGALRNILPVFDVSRLAVTTAESSAMSETNQIGTASALAGQYAKTYAGLLADAIASLQRTYPARIHFTR